MLLLLQATELADRALEVDPYSGVAYGALVFVLGAMSYLLWRENQRLAEQYRMSMEKTIGLMRVIEVNLDSFDEMKDEIKELRHQISNLNSKQK